MKKLLILPLLVLLTGCVTYYYPETALEDGVYYAEDDPSYVVYADPYAGEAFYPWSSLDYFYLGYNPYPGYSFGYGYGGGFSFGISYGYSPWYYPYHNHGYYWHASHYYSHYSAWRPYRGYDSHYGGGNHRCKNKHKGNGCDQYAGNGHNDRQYVRAGKQGKKNDDVNGRDQVHVSNRDMLSTRRYVSTAPAGQSGDRGMVIRSRETTKITKSKLQPGRSVPAPSTSVNKSGSRAAQNRSRPPAKSKAKASSRSKPRPSSSSSDSNRKAKNKASSSKRKR